jgi:putative aldouronate transport system permease protein
MTSTGLHQTHLPVKKHGRFRREFHRAKFVYLMFLPVAVYYIIFSYLPMYGIIIAFQDYQPGMGFFEGADFVGLKNFRELFSSPMFSKLIRNTLLLNLWELAIGFPAPIMLALMLNEVRSSKFKRTVQTISYLPHFIAMVVVIGILKDVLSSEGLFNTIRQFVHVSLRGRPLSDFKPVLYLNIPGYFRPIYTLSGVWQGVGWGSILYLSTLTAIDPELYEAAEIDGAGRFRKMLHVTLPGISPTIIIMLIFAVGGLMSTGFEKLILLYQPLTYDVADTLGTYVYRKGLEETRYSFSTAVNLFTTVINFMLIITVNRISKSVSETSLW